MNTELTNAVTALQAVTDKHEQLNSQYQGTHETLVANTKAMTDWQTQSGSVELTDQNGNKHATPTLKTLVEQAQSVNPHPDVMTKAQFDALRQMRKQQYAGSGFVEWGYGDSTINAVNHGMWVYQNKLNLGRSGKVGGWAGTDKSSSPFPNVLIDGVSHELQSVDYPYGIVSCNFPPAPDGTKTYDSATGTVTQHSNAEVAFASETETNKVITSRKDLVFLESWHEKIADKDVVYPLGNVQYGASSYQGIALLNNLVAQGYSAFGEWDQSTKGYGAKWSALTDEQKAVFLSEPEHNIYYDPKAKVYVQVRYRVRVVEGVGNDWYAVRPMFGAGYFDCNVGLHIRPQGTRVVESIMGSGFPLYADCQTATAKYQMSNTDVGIFGAMSSSSLKDELSGFSGKCFALPIALVQRLNQGAYHPCYNPLGCGLFVEQGVGTYRWYDSQFPTISDTSQLFDLVASGQTGFRNGAIAAGSHGRSDQYKYHDAIYAGQVEDLCLNANKLDVNQLSEDTMRKAVGGTLRGKESVPFTYFEHKHAVTLAEPAYYNAANAGGAIEFKIETGRPTLNNYLSDESNIGYYVYNQDGTSLYIPHLPNPIFSHVHWPFSGGSQVICYIYSVKNKVAEFNSLFSVGDVLHVGVLRKQSAHFDSLPWTDIVGHPERIAATFPDGVVGQWVPSLDDGRKPLNRKVNNETSVNVHWTLNDGLSWSSGVQKIHPRQNDTDPWGVSNNSVALFSYETSADFSERSSNSVVMGHISDVWVGNDSRQNFGCRLQQSLTGKVAQVMSYTTNCYTPVMQKNMLDNKLLRDEFPVHAPYPLLGGDSGTYACKALPTITEKNGLLYMQFHGAEMVYTKPNLSNMAVITAGQAASVEKGKTYILKGFDNASVNRAMVALATNPNFTWAASAFDGYTVLDTGEIITNTDVVYNLLRLYTGGWGDDQTIPIVNGEDIKTDLNGNTVKVFCHHTQFPIGIAYNN